MGKTELVSVCSPSSHCAVRESEVTQYMVLETPVIECEVVGGAGLGASPDDIIELT